MATWIYRYEDLVAWNECLAIDTECGEFPPIIHLEGPRLPNRYAVNHLSLRDVGDFNKDKWMGVDQLEFPHFHFNGEAFLVIVDSDDGVMAKGSNAPKQDDS